MQIYIGLSFLKCSESCDSHRKSSLRWCPTFQCCTIHRVVQNIDQIINATHGIFEHLQRGSESEGTMELWYHTRVNLPRNVKLSCIQNFCWYAWTGHVPLRCGRQSPAWQRRPCAALLVLFQQSPIRQVPMAINTACRTTFLVCCKRRDSVKWKDCKCGKTVWHSICAKFKTSSRMMTSSTCSGRSTILKPLIVRKPSWGIVQNWKRCGLWCGCGFCNVRSGLV